jgi:impB/mucB/samB family C-terminal domain
MVTTLCRDCSALAISATRRERCGDCASPRQVHHAHSISAENTLAHDEADADALAHALWPLCERVSARLKQASLAGRTVTLKLKTAHFRLRTRSRRLADPTQLAETLFRTAAALLEGEADGVTRFRLIGVGADTLVDCDAADPPRPRARPGDASSRWVKFAPDSVINWCGSAAACRPPAIRHTLRHFCARKGGDRMSSCDQQFGFASGSISSSLARIEYSP